MVIFTASLRCCVNMWPSVRWYKNVAKASSGVVEKINESNLAYVEIHETFSHVVLILPGFPT